MATLVLGAVGSAIGGAFGGTILGLSGAVIGGFVGSTVGSVVDSWIVSSLAPAQRIEGQRLDTLRITSATEGAVIPRLYGRMRIGGNILWATDFREETKTTTQGGGKGGGGGKVKTTEYLYYASFAVALCEGAITGIGRVWADGKAMDMTGVTWRWYHFLRRHPGDLTDPGLSGETVRVPAADVIHVLDPVEAGQLRGVSRFAAAIVKLFTLDLYDDAELERKKIAAMFAMFITSPAPEAPLEPTEEDLEVEPGQVVRLDPGEDVSTPATPDSGGTYEPFQYRTLLQIAAALGVPYGYLTGDTARG